jgi:hypothetical protein
MEIKLKWEYSSGEYDTKTMKLIDIPARATKYEEDAELCIADGGNLAIAEIHLGDLDSSNALCKEIVRRFNEFPEELKL